MTNREEPGRSNELERAHDSPCHGVTGEHVADAVIKHKDMQLVGK